MVALPMGEHDYFERKSGALLAKENYRDSLGKAVSAFANSGGGHLVLGVQDDGIFDGVDEFHKAGRTKTRDWLEQIIPNLVIYPLKDFRVHEVALLAHNARIERLPANSIQAAPQEE